MSVAYGLKLCSLNICEIVYEHRYAKRERSFRSSELSILDDHLSQVILMSNVQCVVKHFGSRV